MKFPFLLLPLNEKQLQYFLILYHKICLIKCAGCSLFKDHFRILLITVKTWQTVKGSAQINYLRC